MEDCQFVILENSIWKHGQKGEGEGEEEEKKRPGGEKTFWRFLSFSPLPLFFLVNTFYEGNTGSDAEKK